MKIIFDEKFYTVYDMDSAAKKGRLEPIIEKIKDDPFYEFVKPEPAKEVDILRAHTKNHFESIKRNKLLFDMAMLAAGGAILSAEYGFEKKTSFGLIRPPGHHASADSCWGFCSFNNMSIALLKLISEKKIKSAFILDFDLHTGDGNINVLSDKPEIQILNPQSNGEAEYLKEIEEKFESLSNIDIICASAGFDNAVGDWGNTITTEGYSKIGKMMNDYSKKLCKGRRFAILEGGYKFSLMPINFNSFCKSFGLE